MRSTRGSMMSPCTAKPAAACLLRWTPCNVNSLRHAITRGRAHGLCAPSDARLRSESVHVVIHPECTQGLMYQLLPVLQQ